MLLIPMYHRVRAAHIPDSLPSFERHLRALAQRHPIVVPGESIEKRRVNMCLTFDDAYYDFYHDVFPILQSLQIRAVLAIPVDLLADTISMGAKERLELSWTHAFDPGIKNNPALCSWEEICQMVDSGWVIPASHGATHQSLRAAHVDLQHEIFHSKTRLEEKTAKEVNCFVYPYGQYTRAAEKLVYQNYHYAMRIGSALNQDWDQPTRCLYRIDADHYWSQQKNISALPSLAYHQLRFYANKWPGK